MANNTLLVSLGAWTLTYLAHSTLLLSVAWLSCRYFVNRSHALRERVWKLAAIGGLVTSSLAAFAGWGVSIGDGPVSEVVINANSAEPSVATVELSATSDLVPRADLVMNPVASPGDVVESGATGSIRLDSRNTELPPSGESAARQMRISPLPLAQQPAFDGDMEITPEEYAELEARLLAEAGLDFRTVVPEPIAEELARPDAALPETATSTLNWQQRFRELPALLGAIVGCWMLLGLLRVARQELALHRLLNAAWLIETGEAPRLLSQLLGTATSRLRLLRSDEVTEPIACGVFRPTVLLPMDCEQRLSGEELRALLAHELAHLQRGDVIWLWIGRVLCSSLSFQPLNKIARRAWQVAAEVQCDDWAVEHDVSAITLANCLTRVAEWNLDRRSASVLAATGSRGSLTLRIERLLSDRVPDRWRTRMRSRISLLVAFAFGLLFASVAPRLDESLWARGTTEDLEERLRLWDEIRLEMRSVERDLEQLPDSSRNELDQFRSRIRALTRKPN